MRARTFTLSAPARNALGWLGAVVLITEIVTAGDFDSVAGACSDVVGALGSVLILLALLAGPVAGLTPGLAWRPVQWIGRRSYAIYLWHYPLITAAAYLHVAPVAVAPLAFVFADLSYRLLEHPISELRAGTIREPAVVVR